MKIGDREVVLARGKHAPSDGKASTQGGFGKRALRKRPPRPRGGALLTHPPPFTNPKIYRAAPPNPQTPPNQKGPKRPSPPSNPPTGPTPPGTGKEQRGPLLGFVVGGGGGWLF